MKGNFFKTLLVVAAAAYLPISCASPDVGLGEALDLEGPVVTITSPLNLDFVYRNFTITGNCMDNTGVVSVDVLNKGTGKRIDAVMGPDRRTWRADISLPVDGPFEFDVTAHDKAGNSSSKSIASISVTVDSQSPSAFVFQPALKKADYWTLLWPGSDRTFEDIDTFQNGTITVKGTLDDNYKPQSLKVELVDGLGLTAKEWTLVNGQIFPPEASGTIYAWSYNLDTAALTWNTAPILPSQRYIYKIRLTATDATGNTIQMDPPATSPGYLMVYQNADIPWAKVTSSPEWTPVPPEGIISGNVYDDDGVKDFYVKILSNASPAPGSSDYTTWTTDIASPGTRTLVLKSSDASSPLQDTPRQYTWTLKVPLDAGQYIAYIMPVDKQGKAPSAYQKFNFFVPDVDAPSIEITTNEVLTQKPWPEDGYSDFSIQGRTVDNAGTVEARLAWVPVGVDFAPLFDAATRNDYWVTAITNPPSNPKYIGPTKIVVWPITLGTETTVDGKKVSTWSKSFIFNDDFNVDGTPQYLDRNLVLYAKDGDGNITYSRYTLLGAKTPPTISCTSPNSPNAPYANSFSGDYFNLGGTYATSTKISSIKVATNIGGTLTSKTVTTIDPIAKTWLISSLEFAPLPNGPANFEITITDVYGNKGYASKFVIVDTGAPTVTSVKTSMPSGTYVKAGDTVPILVKFNEPVTITGTASLSMNAGPTQAYYSNGSGSDSLTFYYTLPLGSGVDNSSALDYLNTNALGTTGAIKDSAGNPAVLTLPATGSAGSLREGGSRTIIVDTSVPAAPTISGITSGGYNTSKSFSVSGEASANLEYSLDNGNTWTAGSSKTISTDGIYKITARQTDLAGNRSPNASVINVTIDQTGPAAPFISGITAGTFKTDQSFTVYGEAGATLEYTLDNGSNWVTGSTLVLSTDGTYNIKARQRDAGGNLGAETPLIVLIIDKTAPTVASFSPVNNSTDVNKGSNIVLTFNEPVFKESGTIEFIRPTANNRFPVVMTVDEYNEWKSKVSGINLDDYYSLGTNGAPGGVPSTVGRFVLNYGFRANNASLTTAFTNAGYNKISIDVQSTQVSISGNTVTINPFKDFPIGIDFYINISSTAFRDGVGNYFAGISNSSTYSFVTGPVDTPIIRISKQSGNGSSQPGTTTFQISCESAGINVYYGIGDNAGNAPGSVNTVGTLNTDITIGYGSLSAGNKIYLQARATRTAVTNSSTADEKAFKTVLIGYLNNELGNQTWFRGSNNNGGPTSAPGFPLAWETNLWDKVRLSNTSRQWVTWEINVQTYFKALSGYNGTYPTGPDGFRWQTGANNIVQPGEAKTTGTDAWEPETTWYPIR